MIAGPQHVSPLHTAEIEQVFRAEYGRAVAVFHAIRADLLRRLGRNAGSAAAYEAAMACSQNGAERDFLERSYQAIRG